MGKFKVGDTVRITGLNHFTGYCNSTMKHLGEETEIIHISKFVQKDAYHVKSNGMLWFEEELALIDKSIELEEYEIMDLFEPEEENESNNEDDIMNLLKE